MIQATPVIITSGAKFYFRFLLIILTISSAFILLTVKIGILHFKVSQQSSVLNDTASLSHVFNRKPGFAGTIIP